MEELVILYYGNFSTLGIQAREYAQRTICLNRVADQILQGQLFLDELYREHLGWTTAQKQEWGLFMVECPLHSMATMWKKELKGAPKEKSWRLLSWPLNIPPCRPF